MTKREAEKMEFYAVAENPGRKLEQVLVTRDGAKHSQSFTGVIYPNMADAIKSLGKLNAKLSTRVPQ